MIADMTFTLIKNRAVVGLTEEIFEEDTTDGEAL